MKKIFLLLLMVCGIAHAECYTRVNINLKKQKIDFPQTDIQKIVVPDGNASKCVMQYRININGEWKTAEGVGRGKTENEACAIAIDLSHGYLLSDIAPQTVNTDSQMVCSDLPEIRVHPVKIGDVIWESETDVHPNPEERGYFKYKETNCRFFVERSFVDGGNLWVYTGIMCRLNATKNSKWQIIDKY
jgi:hypothetical protein